VALNKHLKEILACPQCRGPLEIHEEKNEIHCRQCSLIYRIEDDIPILLIEEARPQRAT